MKAYLVKGAFLLVPIFIFFAYLYKHALNVPLMDDMDLISTINDIKDTPANTIEILFRQQNDHRILFSRLGMLVVYFYTGQINFRYTILLGFFNLVILAYAFFLVYTSFRRGIGLFLPVVILLFCPIVYAVHLWSITSFQYTLALAFSLISLYFLQEEKNTNWYWSLPFALASTLTNLDGLSVLPLGLFWLFIQRRYRESILFTVISALWLSIYFFDFRFSNATSVSFSRASLFTIFKSFFAFVGSFAKIFSDTYAIALSIFLGSLILLSFIVSLIYKNLNQTAGHQFRIDWLASVKLDLLDICFLRLLATSCMIAVGRSYAGIEEMMAIRFQVYSVSIVLLFYFLIIRTVPLTRPHVILVMATSCIVSVFSYLKYEKAVILLKQELKADTYNYTSHRIFLHQNSFDPPEDFFKHYHLPQFFDNSTINAWQKGSAYTPSITVTSKEVQSSGSFMQHRYPLLDIEIQNAPKTLPYDRVFLTLQRHSDSTKCYVVSLHDKSNWMHKYFNQASRTFSGFFPLKIPRDKYQLRICWIDNSQPKSILISPNYKL
ncbi:hypothetical protein [Telluribacter sp. SYSU D00476]|uniref:hypothetical protein n=1 Tax=Telluribacter sp. SYSU D00476 TaxID=2811430 RepID=UPI001FF5EDD7|nr:hypothetical protein [Telluribacter sp. SYSU D00476]